MAEILLFVAGTTPQIITETIYALAQQKPPVHPSRIYIVTTRRGKQQIDETLVKRGIITTLLRDYGLPELDLNGDSFVLLRDADGSIIDDVVTKADNEAVADQITALVRGLTSDPSVRLHCSIAGGRKTMGFYLGAALQLFGRPWDKLYHVLVSPAFESLPDFFYKPKKNTNLERRLPDGTIHRLNTKTAVITLAELPFIRLGARMNLGGKSFQELVQEGQREIDTAVLLPEISVDLMSRTIRVGHESVQLAPVQLVVYSSLLRRKKESCLHLERTYCLDCTDCFWEPGKVLNEADLRSLAREHGTIYRRQPGKTDEFLAQWKKVGGADLVRQHVSKINKAIREGVEDRNMQPFYTVTSIRLWGGTRYGIRVEKAKITNTE